MTKEEIAKAIDEFMAGPWRDRRVTEWRYGVCTDCGTNAVVQKFTGGGQPDKTTIACACGITDITDAASRKDAE